MHTECLSKNLNEKDKMRDLGQMGRSKNSSRILQGSFLKARYESQDCLGLSIVFLVVPLVVT
jgi:hypothetical protein